MSKRLPLKKVVKHVTMFAILECGHRRLVHNKDCGKNAPKKLGCRVCLNEQD